MTGKGEMLWGFSMARGCGACIREMGTALDTGAYVASLPGEGINDLTTHYRPMVMSTISDIILLDFLLPRTLVSWTDNRFWLLMQQ